MKLIFRIVKKDFIRLWPKLALWWAILACEALYVVQHLGAVLNPEFKFNASSHVLISPYLYLGDDLYELSFHVLVFVLADIAGLAVIVANVFKADSPIDERAFWRTRPVSGVQMLWSKLVFIGLFCFLVPGAIQAAERIYFDLSPGECLRGFLYFAIIQALLAGAVALVATLAHRIVTVSMALVGLGVILAYFFQELSANDFVSFFSYARAYDATTMYTYQESTAAWISLALALATAVLVAFLIYAGKRRALVMIALLSGLLLAADLYILWPENAYSARVAAAQRKDSLKLDIQYLPIAKNSNSYFGAAFRVMLYGRITNPSLTATKDDLLWIESIYTQLDWSDSKLQIIEHVMPLANSERSPSIADFRTWNGPFGQLVAPVEAFARLGYGKLAWEKEDAWRNIPLLYLTGNQFTHIESEPTIWRGNVYFQSARLVPVADIPLAKSISAWRQAMKSRDNAPIQSPAPDNWRLVPRFISITGKRKGQMATRIRSRNDQYSFTIPPEIALGINELGFSTFPLPASTPTDGASNMYILFNPKTKEAILPYSRSEPPVKHSFSIFTYSYQIIAFRFTDIKDERLRQSPNWELTRLFGVENQVIPSADEQANDEKIVSWLMDAHLLELRFVPQNRFYCPVKIDPFPPPQNTVTTQQ